MRSSATVLILISCFFAKFARSQSHELIIRGVTGKLYLEHTVVPKENWYSVGRLYNVSPKELAPFNHLTLAKSLIIGQTLQIPLTATNFSQNDVKTAGETLVPVIHITGEKEWMYRISVNHNKVPIPNIEKWNHVTPDEIHPGMHLIIGYLKVRTGLSALATNASETPTPAPRVAEISKPSASSSRNTASTTAEPETTTPATSAQSAAVMPKPTGPPPAGNTPATTEPTTGTPAASASTTRTPTASTPAASTSVTSAPPPPAPAPAVSTSSAPHFDGGAFRSDYRESGKTASGEAGVFKSTSGWQDGKYYALMNNVTVGTIVRITDPATNKTVYAKILGQLPDMKESAGLTIRMSNAAAAELGQSESRFAVQISY